MDLDLVLVMDAGGALGVSIPRSEFCGFRRDDGGDSINIEGGFQFLDRNSVDLDLAQVYGDRPRVVVSIPRSEFCGFRLL